MTLSLNEVEATARKAARGAGYAWGLAEDAGKATRWLCARDVDGCRALAALLSRVDGEACAAGPPVLTGAIWTARAGSLCPITTGAALSDRAATLGKGDIRLGPTAHPILLAPFAALAAEQIGQPVTLDWGESVLATDGNALSQTRPAPDTASHVTVRLGGRLGPLNPRRHRADPAPEIWRTLERFAHRTYAPATEASRQKGAGAGQSDND